MPQVDLVLDIFIDLERKNHETRIQLPNLNTVRSRFFNAKFDGFWQLSQKVLKLQKSFIYHLKALIFSSLEVQRQSPRPPNKASTPS